MKKSKQLVIIFLVIKLACACSENNEQVEQGPTVSTSNENRNVFAREIIHQTTNNVIDKDVDATMENRSELSIKLDRNDPFRGIEISTYLKGSLENQIDNESEKKNLEEQEENQTSNMDDNGNNSQFKRQISEEKNEQHQLPNAEALQDVQSNEIQNNDDDQKASPPIVEGEGQNAIESSDLTKQTSNNINPIVTAPADPIRFGLFGPRMKTVSTGLSVERHEKINQGFEKLIHFVNIVGQLDSFFTDRAKTMARKIAVLTDSDDDMYRHRRSSYRRHRHY